MVSIPTSWHMAPKNPGTFSEIRVSFSCATTRYGVSPKDHTQRTWSPAWQCWGRTQQISRPQQASPWREGRAWVPFLFCFLVMFHVTRRCSVLYHLAFLPKYSVLSQAQWQGQKTESETSETVNQDKPFFLVKW